VRYIRPQEFGNKTDVRWVALTDADGRGLLAVGMPHLEVSAHHYRSADLEAAAHTHLILYPSIALTFTILFWMLLGEALQKALDPTGS